MSDLPLWSALLAGFITVMMYHGGRSIGHKEVRRTDQREKAHIWEDAHAVGYFHARKLPPSDGRTESGADHARETNPFIK